MIYQNLNHQIVDVDESIHIRVALNHLESKSLTPTFRNELYIAKPGFNITSNTLFVKQLNEFSLYGFRLLSVFYAFATSILIFFFAKSILHSTSAILVAAIAIFASPVFIFSHIARSATQDSALLFYTTLSLLSFNHYFHQDQKQKSLFLDLGIVSCVIASLIKSVAGLLPAIIASIYYIFLKKKIDANSLFFAAKVLLLSSLPLIVYYLSLFYYFPESYQAFLSEIPKRFTKGYHNSGDYLFYIKELIANKYGLFYFFLAGFILSFFQKNKSLSFLKFSLIALLILLSILNSKLTWYFAITFPLIAIFTAYLFELQYKFKPIFLIIFFVFFAFNVYSNQKKYQVKKYSKFNQVVDYILNMESSHQKIQIYFGPNNVLNRRNKTVLLNLTNESIKIKIKDLSRINFSQNVLLISGKEFKDPRLKRLFEDDLSKKKKKVYYYINT